MPETTFVQAPKIAGKEASTRCGSGHDLSMLAEAGALDPADETFREYERVVDTKSLDQIRAEAKQFSTKLLSRQARLAEGTVRKFKNEKNSLRPRSLRKLTKAIHDLQNKKTKNAIHPGRLGREFRQRVRADRRGACLLCIWCADTFNRPAHESCWTDLSLNRISSNTPTWVTRSALKTPATPLALKSVNGDSYK
jgi:hypothetical protein